ncbi:cadherin-like and PC-esterase domain-containing protein 1 isoform X2 [Nerophis lumbriciformis]|uniref:cadherin-like and PC-esterase domain-containing protein 1 isoform X2 n=1 Tax=Nerophis lumbriciformis TaxID=546530 RepID=UPI002AE0ACEA|nr:cadherin-like and PC-esterase domain-containing protein 1 isoform X2 [Nerophis lumbriciformis]
MLSRRRRGISGPLLVLLGAAGCLFYQSLTGQRSGPQQAAKEPPDSPTEDDRKLVKALEGLQMSHMASGRRRALVVMGSHPHSDTEVQLYHRVLHDLDYEVHKSTYFETSSFVQHNQGQSGWSLLLCSSSSERSCLRKVAFSHLRSHQMVNLLPGLVEALSASALCQLTARGLPIMPPACSHNRTSPHGPVGADSASAVESGLVAVVNVYVVVTSVRPLTAFLHEVAVVTDSQMSRATQLSGFLLQRLPPKTSQEALGQAKEVIGQVLEAALSANKEAQSLNRCVLCYQLLTFTLLFSGSIKPLITQVDAGLTLSALSDRHFDRQVTRDVILEDTLHFLLSSETQSDDEQRGVFTETSGVRMSADDFLLLRRFHGHVMAPRSFQLVCPGESSSRGASRLSDMLLAVVRHHGSVVGRADQSDAAVNQSTGSCVDARLRQIYTDPPLTLSPPFSPHFKEYHTEVTFDTLMIRVRAEPASAACGVRLDERRTSREFTFPVGLGHNRVNILVTDEAASPPSVVAVYTVHVYREGRPSLPMFGDHVTCGYVQDCGLVVLPNRPCGLEPFSRPTYPLPACTSGHSPGRWLVPCLSCSDNRTCDWRKVAWQPDSCYHGVVKRPLLQECMAGRKVLFLGDSTNRGMMYFLMERLNSSLVDWDKAHEMLVYKNLNHGRTWVSYSYYPQFWLDHKQRPTFKQALTQLLQRSGPLMNSEMTVLVVGGVQWLNSKHLWMVREVLDSESLSGVQVVVKSLGMGFHLPVDGIRFRSPKEIQKLPRENQNIITAAKHHGYEVIDTLAITMGRYQDFLPGRCACHFHQVDKFCAESAHRTTQPGSQSNAANIPSKVKTNTSSYHVIGAVNQVYADILLSRLCPIE